MKLLTSKVMRLVSNVAFVTAFAVIGTTCRSWLYQPPTPARLLEMDK